MKQTHLPSETVRLSTHEVKTGTMRQDRTRQYLTHCSFNVSRVNKW